MSSSIRSVIEKNRFKGSDEIIRKAFKIYSEKDLEYSMRDFDFEYNDDKIFEDKIYSVISRLPIKNPRSKAHIICIAVVCFVLIAGLAIGYIYMGSQKQTGETSVLESVCSTARERYALRQDYIMMGDDDADLGINTKEEQQWHYYNQQNTAVCVDTKSYSENGYLYSLYQLNEDEEKKITQKGIELKKADKTKKLTPFLGNAPKGSKYSVGSIYFIGGRNSRKFILYKDRSDAMYIGKCVGIESLKEHSIKDRKKSGAKSGISPEEYFKEIMDIKDGSAIREIMLERFKAKSKENPDKRLAVWADEKSGNEFYKLLTKGNYFELRDMYKQKFVMTAKENPDKCYYLAVENNAGELCVFGIILDENNIDVYIEPEHKAGVYLKLSDENAAALKKIIKKNYNSFTI